MKGEGRKRQEIPNGTIVGTTKILFRTNRKTGRPGDNEQYLYAGECLRCGTIQERRIGDFRERKRCVNCPPQKSYQRPIVVRTFVSINNIKTPVAKGIYGDS
jgi:hypothetical protein